MSPTIQEQADQVRAASTGRLPAEVIEAFARDRERMLDRGTPSEAVVAGDLLQDFILPDATGKDVSLSGLATMVAISPQKPDESLSTAERHALEYPVLSDAGARIARRLGVAFQPAEDVLEAQRALGLDIRDGNADGASELPMPTVLVVDRDRIVRFADIHPDYTSRTEVPAILSALDQL